MPGNGDQFRLWAERWMALARFSGPHLTDPAGRIAQGLGLWHDPIPGSWERRIGEKLLGPRYRRGDMDSPHAGEHAIEHEILSQLEAVNCLESKLLDGVNAVPLTRDETGGRSGNVEADLLLLAKQHDAYRLIVCEVKHSSNTCWYAALENLRQLKLLHGSKSARQIFHYRNPQLGLPAEIPIVGLVVAPPQYYVHPGQKGKALPHARKLLKEFTALTGLEAHLATWDSESTEIKKL